MIFSASAPGAGHSGSFNPAAITKHEAHMINGNMDSKKEHKKESSSPKITIFLKWTPQINQVSYSCVIFSHILSCKNTFYKNNEA